MSLNPLTNMDAPSPNADLDRLRNSTANTAEEEKLRLKRATKEFESFFMYQMLKTMRKTVPESSFANDGVFKSGMGKDIFTDMFDMEIAKKMNTRGDQSIGEILYNSLEHLIDDKYGVSEEKVEMKPLVEPEREKYQKLKSPLEKIEKEEKPDFKLENQKYLPIGGSKPIVNRDSLLSRYGEIINEAAEETGLDPALIISVIKAESSGDHKAISNAGAKGLMQLMDTTAADLNVKDSFDPKENVMAGSKYLKSLLDRFGSVELALAGYNAGPGNVIRYDGIPPFEETEAYVEKVMNHLSQSLESDKID